MINLEKCFYIGAATTLCILCIYNLAVHNLEQAFVYYTMSLLSLRIVTLLKGGK